MSNNTFNTNNQKPRRGWFFWIAVILILLLIGLWLLGYGPWGRHCDTKQTASTAAAATAVSKPAAPTQTPAPAPAAPAPVATESSPLPPPEAKVYFSINRMDTPSTVQETLVPVVNYLQKNPQAIAQLTGFHDPSGSIEKNLVLASERSMAVQASLIAMGVAKNRIEILTPSQTTGTGKPSEARRVEVNAMVTR